MALSGWRGPIFALIAFSSSFACAERAFAIVSESTFINAVGACALSANLHIDADLQSSLQQLYDSAQAQGHFDNTFETKFLDSFPEADRLKAYSIYESCVAGALRGDVDPTQIKTFSSPDFPSLDGNGYHSGAVASPQVTIVETSTLDQSKATRFNASYGFYNGSGTWRGDQTFSVSFVGQGNNILQTVSFGLDRGHCVYGHAEERHAEGPIENILPFVARVDWSLSRVSGTQTGC